jgi:DNA-binding transcriptional ArsR family regulator
MAKKTSPQSTADTSPSMEVRELTDPKTMRALTHPVRLALLEALALDGPLTATEAGELIGESPTTCSFHFRQLAKYGFVEEAGGGAGRQRPWKMAHVSMNFSDAADDPETNVAAKGLERLVFDRAISRLQRFKESKSNFPKEWQNAATTIESVMFVTAKELSDLSAQVIELLTQFQDRLSDASLRPKDSLPVEVLTFAFPVRLPEVPS